MTAQILEIAGHKVAVLPIAEYERLLDIAEDKDDVAAAVAAERRRLDGEEYVPAELVDRLMAGESPLKAWRQHRGFSQQELAAAAQTHHSTLSRIESGELQGRPSLWRRLAEVLNVSADDILPQG
jgi:ribosome-binding protein aMBF1 (putative translation factor)